MTGLEGTSLGRYRLKQRLGRGGMAEVYLATDERMRREVAVKIVRSSNTEFSQRFDREAQTMGKLHHDHILAAYDYGEQEPWHYLVMPYIQHGTLSDLLQKGPLPLEHAGELLQQVAAGLQYAHQQGILHRDIKPSNILLRDDHYAYLCDFGLARVQEGAQDLTQTGVLLGTPEYMAPELAEGPATVSSDIYALAIVLYQMISGRVPFRGETAISIFWKHVREQPLPPSQFKTDLPPAVDRMLMRALEKDPALRYSSALALSQAYQEAITELDAMPDLYETEVIKDNRSLDDYPVPPADRTQKATQPAMPALEELPRQASKGSKSRPPLTPVAGPMPAPRPYFEQTTDIISSRDETVLPPSRRRRRRRNSRVLGGIIIGLVFLLLVSGILGFLVVQAHQQNNVTGTVTASTNAANTVVADQTQQAQNTQQARTSAEATATAQVQATRTAIAATATTQAQATQTAIAATATVVTGSTPLASDPLSSQDSNGWADDGTSCLFTNNNYSANVSGSNTFQSCISDHLQYADAAIQVNATLISGDSAGIIFRSNTNATQFYDFEITANGQFFLRFRNNGRYTMIIPDTDSSAIHSKGNTNTLLVIVDGSDFKLFVNGEFVAETHDSTFSNGLLGVAVGTTSSTSGEASFDSLNIYQP